MTFSLLWNYKMSILLRTEEEEYTLPISLFYIIELQRQISDETFKI